MLQGLRDLCRVGTLLVLEVIHKPELSKVRERIMKHISLKIILLVWLGCASQSWGYQLYKLDNGNYVKWNRSTLKYRVHKSMSKDLSKQETLKAIQMSFTSWQRALKGSMKIKFDGVSSGKIGYDPSSSDNENLLVWEEKNWEFDKGFIAMTLVTFRKSTGTILDADIVFNGVDYKWVNKQNNGKAPKHAKAKNRLVPADLQNTLTHELGHLLGLEHSHNTSATMFESQTAGETSKRQLHLDDHNAIRTLYSVEDGVEEKTVDPRAEYDLPPPLPSMACNAGGQHQPHRHVTILIFCFSFFLLFFLSRRSRRA